MKFSSLVLVGVLILTVLTLHGCKKYRLNKQTTSAEDNALAEDSFDDIFKHINEAADEQNLDGIAKVVWTSDYTFSSSCATITLNPPAWDTTMSPPAWNNTFPKTLTIDFGSANCVGNDNKARKGKIISVFSGKHNETGTVVNTTLDDYHVNDYHIEGTKIAINDGSNSFSIEVDGKVTSPDGNDQVSWKSTRTRTWIEGQTTNFWTLNPDSSCCEFFDGILDDVYSITGTASGVNRNGRMFQAEITVPLRVEFCGWIPEITEGTVEIEPEDLMLRIVDFGDRVCDRTFVVTIGNKSYTKTY